MRVIAMFSGPCAADALTARGSVFSPRLQGVRVIAKTCNQLNLIKNETIASLPGFGMAPEGYLSYSSGPNIRAGRTKPCSVRVRIDPIPPQE